MYVAPALDGVFAIGVGCDRTLDQMRTVLAEWRRDYNETRPHASIGTLAPGEYAAKLLMGSAT